MARPPKLQQVDYFPHMCKHGETMYIVEQRYGNDGYAFWFKLLELLGSKNGHALDTTQPDSWEFLQARTRCSEQKCRDILDLLAKLEAIDRELWTKDGVVWSQNFTDNLCHVYKKRATETPQKPSFRSGNPPSRVVSVTEIRQRKGQERTGEEREPARPISEPETFHPDLGPLNPDALTDHTWQAFRSSMPLRLGKFTDEDAVRQKWARSPAIHNQVLAAVKHYATSSEVADGAVMSPMKFISGRYKDWLEPETQPLGGEMNDAARRTDAENLEKEQTEYAARIAAPRAKRERMTLPCQTT